MILFGRDLIVVGASAGGVQALTELLRGLPADLPAAVFVVVHTAPGNPGILPRILDRAGPLPCAHATDGERVRHGQVFVAPPDHHLLIKHAGRGKGARAGFTVRVVRGPKENGFRPAVDPLFRTAARVGGPRAVGVVLSGSLDDGTEGLMLIKKCGGTALVQDPAEATFPGMPASAVANVDVDQVLPVAAMPAVLMQLATEPLSEGASLMPAGNGEESDVAEIGDNSLAAGDLPGPPSGFTCPECSGALWELRAGKLMKFRCHVGHAYSTEGILAEHTRNLEASLWTALRALEESAALRRRMARRSRASNWHSLTQDYERQADDAEARAALIRRTLMSDEPETETIRAGGSPRPAWDGKLYGKPGARNGRPNGKRPGKHHVGRAKTARGAGAATTGAKGRPRATPSTKRRAAKGKPASTARRGQPT